MYNESWIIVRLFGTYIENELSASISTDEIIETYGFAASRRANFKLIHM
jgi:hypothetical protein